MGTLKGSQQKSKGTPKPVFEVQVEIEGKKDTSLSSPCQCGLSHRGPTIASSPRSWRVPQVVSTG